MNTKQERELETLRRAHEFLVHNPPTPAPANLAVQVKVLGDTLEKLTHSAVDQNMGRRLGKQETGRQRAIRQRLRKDQMQPVARIARALLPDAPGIDKALRPVSPRIRNEALIIEARAMAEAATPYRRIFVENGIPATFVEDLKASAAEIEKSLNDRRAHRGRRGWGTTGVRAEVANARQAVKLLDAIVRPFYERDPKLSTGWNDAKRVTLVSGVGGVMSGSSPTTPIVSTTPAAPPVSGTAGGGVPTPASTPPQTGTGVAAHA
ncbi:MAG: hypothetical protein NVS1B4_26250 [Gemmatimonadaceae bacterium]